MIRFGTPRPPGYFADILLREMRARPEQFPNAIRNLVEWGERTKNQWIGLVKSNFRERGQISWWIKQYLGPGGSNIKWRIASPAEIIVWHSDEGSKYDFGRVVHRGRAQYDMRQIVNSSPRARIIKHGKDRGKKYLIIAIRNRDAKPGMEDFSMKKTGEYKDLAAPQGPVVRNTYQYDRVSKNTRGNLAMFTQKDKLGRAHRTFANLVTLKADSPGWRYPAMKGVDYPAMVRDAVRSGRARNRGKTFAESSYEALLQDALNLFLRTGKLQ